MDCLNIKEATIIVNVSDFIFCLIVSDGLNIEAFDGVFNLYESIYSFDFKGYPYQIEVVNDIHLSVAVYSFYKNENHYSLDYENWINPNQTITFTNKDYSKMLEGLILNKDINITKL